MAETPNAPISWTPGTMPKMPQPKMPFITTTQAAAILGITPWQVRKLVAQGVLVDINAQEGRHALQITRESVRLEWDRRVKDGQIAFDGNGMNGHRNGNGHRRGQPLLQPEAADVSADPSPAPTRAPFGPPAKAPGQGLQGLHDLTEAVAALRTQLETQIAMVLKRLDAIETLWM